ncbi:MAG: hypothetical protein PHP43_09060, partial [Methanoculleus sp.]|nr:hypothetical protein [Methanoculleus sp.]
HPGLPAMPGYVGTGDPCPDNDDVILPLHMRLRLLQTAIMVTPGRPCRSEIERGDDPGEERHPAGSRPGGPR